MTYKKEANQLGIFYKKQRICVPFWNSNDHTLRAISGTRPRGERLRHQVACDLPLVQIEGHIRDNKLFTRRDNRNGHFTTEFFHPPFSTTGLTKEQIINFVKLLGLDVEIIKPKTSDSIPIIIKAYINAGLPVSASLTFARKKQQVPLHDDDRWRSHKQEPGNPNK